jgi:hypothetical protein
MAAWPSGQRICPKTRRSGVRISLGCKVFLGKNSNAVVNFYIICTVCMIYNDMYIAYCGLVWFQIFLCSLVSFGLVWFSLVWFSLVWFGLVWFGLVWFGLV